MVYGYWQIETRIKKLEEDLFTADEQIRSLLDRHVLEEKEQRDALAEKVAFYEKEFNINPLSWGKKGKKK